MRKINKEIKDTTRENAEAKMDQLLRLQGVLSRAVFVNKVNISPKLMNVVHQLERLHDEESREYWFKRFQSGAEWP